MNFGWPGSSFPTSLFRTMTGASKQPQAPFPKRDSQIDGTIHFTIARRRLGAPGPLKRGRSGCLHRRPGKKGAVDQKAVVMTATRKYPIPHLTLGRGCRRSWPSSAARSRGWWIFRCRRYRFLAACSPTATKAKLFSQTGSAFRISGCGYWMLSGQFPASTILVDAQSMPGQEMPSEHLAAPAAFEANDVIAVNRSPDWHGGVRWVSVSAAGFLVPESA